MYHCLTLQNLPKFDFWFENKPSGNLGQEHSLEEPPLTFETAAVITFWGQFRKKGGNLNLISFCILTISNISAAADAACKNLPIATL
jgi:hypothetical protein